MTGREHPYEPEPGTAVMDKATGRVGRVLGTVSGKYWLRPIGGGQKWEADPDSLRPAQAAELSQYWTEYGRISKVVDR